VDYRAFTANRPSAADAYRRCQSLHHCYALTDSSATDSNGLHDFRRSFASGFSSQQVNDDANQQAAGDGQNDDVVLPEEIKEFSPPVEEEPSEAPDHVAEAYGSQTGEKADEYSQSHGYGCLRPPYSVPEGPQSMLQTSNGTQDRLSCLLLLTVAFISVASTNPDQLVVYYRP